MAEINLTTQIRCLISVSYFLLTGFKDGNFPHWVSKRKQQQESIGNLEAYCFQ